MTPIAPNHVVGGYRLVAKIPDGSLGHRFAATTSADTPVIIELVSVRAEDELFERSLHRITVMATVRHDHLVPILDAGLDGDVLFMVTPQPAYTANSLGAIGMKAAPVMAEVAAGLGHLHRRGIVHRDIQLRHIGVYAGAVRLGGFGLSDLAGNGRTNGVGPLGGVLTMAPSIVRGEAATFGSDVYSFGAALHLLATGHAVHRVQTETLSKRICRIGTDAPTIHRSLPGPLYSAVACALETDGAGGEAAAVLASLTHDIDGSLYRRAVRKEQNHV